MISRVELLKNVVAVDVWLAASSIGKESKVSFSQGDCG